MILATEDPGGKGKGRDKDRRPPQQAPRLEFVALGERLERLRARHEQGLVNSIEFLKALLSLAKDVVEAEQSWTPKTGRPGPRPRSRSSSAR